MAKARCYQPGCDNTPYDNCRVCGKNACRSHGVIRGDFFYCNQHKSSGFGGFIAGLVGRTRENSRSARVSVSPSDRSPIPSLTDINSRLQIWARVHSSINGRSNFVSSDQFAQIALALEQSLPIAPPETTANLKDVELEQIQDLVTRGTAFLKQSRWQEAVDCFLEAIRRSEAASKRDARNFWYHSWRALAWYGLFSVAEAAANQDAQIAALHEAYFAKSKAFVLAVEELIAALKRLSG